MSFRAKIIGGPQDGATITMPGVPRDGDRHAFIPVDSVKPKFRHIYRYVRKTMTWLYVGPARVRSQD